MIKKADLKYSILVYPIKINNEIKYDIYDGLHRLSKAIQNKFEEINAIIISDKILSSARVGDSSKWPT
jgi:hypothetical protein